MASLQQLAQAKANEQNSNGGYDWSTHTWNKGSQKQNYVDQYRKNLWEDLQKADTDGDKHLSNAEFGKVWDKMYDIIGDGRAPHSGGWFDKGAGAQNALAKLITRQGLKVDNDLLNRFGLRQDQETGDILAGVGFKHRESNFGRDADDDLSSWEGYSTKNDFADSHWSFSDYGDKIPTYRYKWSNTNAWEKPKDDTDPPVTCTPPQVLDPGGSGTCISPPGGGGGSDDDTTNKGNDWNIGDDIPQKGNPKSTFPGMNFTDFIKGMGVKLGISQNPMEQMGSIPYVTSGNYFNARSDWQNNTTGYKPKHYQKGKFDTFLHSNKPGDATLMADDLIGNLFNA